MSKIAVVYWSGTGNTEAMANEVAEGAKAAGAEVDVLTASEFGADKMDVYDAVQTWRKEDRTLRILRMGRR